jgi:hypothetical protein
MFYVNSADITFDLTLTLGSEETKTPPALMLGFDRKGTNNSGTWNVPPGQIVSGDRFLEITGIPTNLFEFTGQYNYVIYNVDIPANPVEIESGLFIVITTPITKTEYGTDKIRGEYKGHL